MSAQHTPAPWAVHPVHARVDCAKPSKLGGLLPVAQMLWPTTERSEAETEANARLIAAAPDLLSAAQDWINHMDSDGEDASFEQEMAMLEALRAAIAKATGAA